MVYICIKFGKNIKGFQSYGAEMLLILFIKKGHNSLNIIHGVKVLFSAHRLNMVYICTKFKEKYLERFQSYGAYSISMLLQRGIIL